MENSIFALLFILSLLAISPVLAVSQPPNFNPLSEKTIYSVTGASIEGESCSNQYKVTGSYCSGNIRQYFQCLPSSSGLTWQKRSENCGDYNYICYAGDCVPSSTSNIFKQKFLLIFIITALTAVAFYFGTMTKR